MHCLIGSQCNFLSIGEICSNFDVFDVFVTTPEVSRYHCLSLIRTGWCGRTSHNQKLAKIPMGGYAWLVVNFPLVVELNLVKFRQRFSCLCLPWGKHLTLAHRG